MVAGLSLTKGVLCSPAARQGALAYLDDGDLSPALWRLRRRTMGAEWAHGLPRDRLSVEGDAGRWLDWQLTPDRLRATREAVHARR